MTHRESELHRRRRGWAVRLTDIEEGVALGKNAADGARGDVAALEGSECGVGKFNSYGHEQAAGRLRIEEQVAILLRNGIRKGRAIADEFAIVLETAREMPFARGFYRAGKVFDARVI